MQIRFMAEHEPPFRVIVPGQVYRYEATDASHDMQFWQLEGFMVDRRDAPSPVTMQTLISVLATFFDRFFEKTVALRVRPSYFPFVEPGIEGDVSCIVCGGKGCSVCKGTGWVEVVGAGMIHPKVFDAVKYNPKDLSGFAFGFGIDRLAMLKYRIPDIRLFRYGDLRFLKQFLR
jgi:phenylalanyl-tRNA synthetase alpha chain